MKYFNIYVNFNVLLINIVVFFKNNVPTQQILKIPFILL